MHRRPTYIETISTRFSWLARLMHVCLVAFAVVEPESKGNWSWFLIQMCEAIIDMDQELVIISNKQKGLMDSVPFVLPNAHYSSCLRHLAQNLYEDASDNLVRKYIWTVAQQFT